MANLHGCAVGFSTSADDARGRPNGVSQVCPPGDGWTEHAPYRAACAGLAANPYVPHPRGSESVIN